MSGSTENQMSGAPERAGGPNVLFTWTVAQRMLPLVGRIVDDLLRRRQDLARMEAEKANLDRNRRTLAWPGRARRYQLQEELTETDKQQRAAVAELEGLGVTLIDPGLGQVGFPTTVNNRRAFFSWRPGDNGLAFWHFAEETARRPVPPTWTKGTELRRRTSSLP
jgi:hypothetical protein